MCDLWMQLCREPFTAVKPVDQEPLCELVGWSLHRVQIAGQQPTVHSVGEIRWVSGSEGRVTTAIQDLHIASTDPVDPTPKVYLRTESGRTYVLRSHPVGLFGAGAHVFLAWCLSKGAQATDVTKQITERQLRLENGILVEAM